VGFSILGTRFFIGLPFISLMAAYALFGMGWEAAIAFLSVAAHEAAHALVASAYDLEIESVELTPFGGVARISGLMQQDPYVETSVALAGPASSFLLAGLSAYLWRAGLLPDGPPGIMLDVNVMLGLVNLLPVLPLDGGRIARANLSKSIGFKQATWAISALGRALAIVALLAGLILWYAGIPYPNLLVYAAFGYIFARTEQKSASITGFSILIRRKENMARQGIIHTQQMTAMHYISLERVANGFSSRHYSVVTILDDNMRQVGTLSEAEIVEQILAGNGRLSLGEALSH